MNGTIASGVVAAYVGAVRDELADLSDDDRIDLMDDVAEHVATVAAEYDDLTMDVLVERLGAPAPFAAELREAAGLVPVPTVEVEPKDGFLRRLGRFTAVVFALGAVALIGAAVVVGLPGILVAAAIVALAAVGLVVLLTRGGTDWKEELEKMPGASPIRRARVWFTEQSWSDDAVGFIVSLRPAWWVVRGAAVALALGFIFLSIPVALVTALPLTALSVWFGWRGRGVKPTARRRVVAVAANAALALTTLGVVIGVYGQATQPWYYVTHDPYQEVYVEAGPTGDGMVYRDDGTLVTNLFPYGPDGQLLEGVRLYDQDGRPFELGLADDCEKWAEPGWVYLPRGDAKNAFPHRLIEADSSTGECLEPVTVPPFGPFLPGSPVTEPTPDPIPEPTPPVVEPTSAPDSSEPPRS